MNKQQLKKHIEMRMEEKTKYRLLYQYIDKDNIRYFFI